MSTRMRMARRGIPAAGLPWEIVRRVADYVRAGKEPYMITAEQFGRAVAALVSKFPERDALTNFRRGFDEIINRKS